MREDLSRLWSGDLPPAEADALRARIRAEPELARQWEELVGLTEALANLPEAPPPAWLDARVLGRPSGRPGRGWRWALGAGLAAAAAALILWARPVPPAQVVLELGRQRIDGRAEVLAAGLPVRVDGDVTITVEPWTAPARVTGSEGSMKTVMAGSAGAVLGAVVTVAVTGGAAWVGADPAQELGPGVSRVVRLSAPDAGMAMVMPELPPDAPPEQQVVALQAQVTALQAELERLRFSEGVARGQLAATQGEPSVWPDDVPAGYRPEEFEAALGEVLAKFPGLSVDALDCNEYPCIAMLAADGPLESWQDRLRDLPKSFPEDRYADSSVSMAMSQTEDDQGSHGAIGLSLAPEGALADEAQAARLQWRMQTLMQDAAAPQ